MQRNDFGPCVIEITYPNGNRVNRKCILRQESLKKLIAKELTKRRIIRYINQAINDASRLMRDIIENNEKFLLVESIINEVGFINKSCCYYSQVGKQLNKSLNSTRITNVAARKLFKKLKPQCTYKLTDQHPIIINGIMRDIHGNILDTFADEIYDEFGNEL